MSENFKIQEWDTNFFGFKVAKTEMDYLWSNSITKLEGLFNEDIELVIFNSTKPDFEKLSNKYYDIVKVYNRIPIIKEVKTLTKNHPNISSYRDELPSPELIKLAKLAAKEGRFGRDSQISVGIYNKIFEEWITNSIKGIIADDVLVYKHDEKVVGFGTIKIEGENGYAPLFAVNRNFEGKGVSFALMRAVENKLIEQGCKYLVSGTQEINRKALSSLEGLV
ncbi:GNAT family N-acetyltransferase [Salegentibacter salegens]|uniref:N-acetyltransferase domain-containing protein n=1 Tax=Salegentibacter salegens TaxID=143223 RepID=A0A1M7HB53_9FLAO|nr:GNAT family N-acetyltransferase [Salegentibacter salegens]PRX43521.1 hypothetical protein LY58_02329 [Salegentibacter salegens]SHM25831.1 hypothetical protein SAMN05878281_0064 [Salegentibacter salegens]